MERQEYDHQMSFLGDGASPRQAPEYSSEIPAKNNNTYSNYDSVPSADDNALQPVLQRRTSISIFSWWKFELMASVISIGSIMALALVVRRYEGRPLEDINLPHSLQLSAIVAALSTIARVSLLVPVASAMSQDSWLWFSSPRQRKEMNARLKDMELTDNASRGPWGSFLFLLKARRRYFSYVGAIITILSLGISVFTQQLVVYEVLPLNHGIPTLANIPRSQSWSSNEGIMDAVVKYINPHIKAAIFNGFFSSDIQPPLLNCPTGNCTWPATPSLAVCGGCTKNDFTQTCGQTNGVPACNFTAPSGTRFLNGTGVYFKSVPGTGSVYNSSDPSRVYLANWDVGGVSNTSYGWAGWNKTTFVTYECALWACVQSYSASVQSSSQSQVQSTSWSNVIGIQNSSNAYQVNSTFGNPTNGSDSSSSSDQYTVTRIAATLLRSYFIYDNDFLNGTVSASGSRGITYSNDYIEVIYNATQYTNLDNFTKNIAVSMSNVFRTAEPAQNDIYNGTASTLSVAVKWHWLTLPIILVAASLLLSLVNIVRTARSDIGAWKGGPLALLVCDVDQTVKASAVENMDTPGGLLRSIGNKKAVLCRNEKGGWVFEAS